MLLFLVSGTQMIMKMAPTRHKHAKINIVPYIPRTAMLDGKNCGREEKNYSSVKKCSIKKLKLDFHQVKNAIIT